MLSCKEVAKSLSSDDELSWIKRAELRMHLMMCKLCSLYAQELKMMKKGFQKLFSQLTEVSESEINRLENEITEKIKKTGS